jgi:TPR repeat protein
MRKGMKVFLRGLPYGWLDDLPSKDQKAISAIIGKPILFHGVDKDGRAELEFVDAEGDIHFIYVDRKYVATPKEKKNDELFKQACALWDKRRFKAAFRLFMSVVENGDTSASINIGYFYDCGIGTKKDTKEALRWYLKAHRHGDSSATHNIGTVYRDLGDQKRALQWFERALERGNDDAAAEIGKIHLSNGNLELAETYIERTHQSDNVSEQSVEDAAKLLRKVHRLRRLQSA